MHWHSEIKIKNCGGIASQPKCQFFEKIQNGFHRHTRVMLGDHHYIICDFKQVVSVANNSSNINSNLRLIELETPTN